MNEFLNSIESFRFDGIACNFGISWMNGWEMTMPFAIWIDTFAGTPSYQWINN